MAAVAPEQIDYADAMFWRLYGVDDDFSTYYDTGISGIDTLTHVKT